MFRLSHITDLHLTNPKLLKYDGKVEKTVILSKLEKTFNRKKTSFTLCTQKPNFKES